MKIRNIHAPKRDNNLLALPRPAKGNDQIKNATIMGMARYSQAMKELAEV